MRTDGSSLNFFQAIIRILCQSLKPTAFLMHPKFAAIAVDAGGSGKSVHLQRLVWAFIAQLSLQCSTNLHNSTEPSLLD